MFDIFASGDCKSKRTIFYPQRAFTITNVRLLWQFTDNQKKADH
jgi:hypothetical protein